MGGYGSGRSRSWGSRDTVEGYRHLDVRKLQRDGCLRFGSVFRTVWTNRAGEETSSIGGQAYLDRLVLSYKHKSRSSDSQWQDVEEPVQLTWTRCNYGGQRPWFICPGSGCGRRVAILYSVGKYYLCRHCYRLAYRSQGWGRADRLMEKARRIRMRLGGSANLIEPFPWKPRWMRWSKYWRLRDESEEANRESWYANPFTRRLLRGMT